jgi:hypothetical protein
MKTIPWKSGVSVIGYGQDYPYAIRDNTCYNVGETYFLSGSTSQGEPMTNVARYIGYTLRSEGEYAYHWFSDIANKKKNKNK